MVGSQKQDGKGISTFAAYRQRRSSVESRDPGFVLQLQIVAQSFDNTIVNRFRAPVHETISSILNISK
jgi:hypothetical protein